MKFRSVIFLMAFAFAASLLVSCGGGDAMGVLSSVPKGDYYQLEGSNPAARYNSELFTKISDELDKFEDEKEKWEDTLDEMGVDNPNTNTMKLSITSEEAEENLSYTGGRFTPDGLEDYYTDDDFGGWDDWNEEDREGRVYYAGKRFEQNYAVFMMGNGFFHGTEDIIEDVIDVITKGKRRMVDTEEFRENRDLVDFSAANFMLHFDNSDNLARNMKSLIQMVDDDDDILDPIDDLNASGISVYWTNEMRIVVKLRFDDDKDLDELYEFLKEDMDKVMKKIGPNFAQNYFGNDVDTDDIEDLADFSNVSRSGANIVIEIRIPWDFIEEMIS